MYRVEDRAQTKKGLYPALPVEKSARTTALRVCFVMHKCVGPTQNNGLGTAYTLLGEALAAEGHQVTFLYVTTKCERHTLDFWAQHYKEKSISFVLLPHSDAITFKAPEWLIQPYRIYQWLKNQAFDVIHYPEYPGHGYFLALAKHQGLAFSDSLLCIGTHGPSMWSREANGYQVNTVRHLAINFLEQQTAALSDVLISPSQATVQWLLGQEWKLPKQTYVQQNIQSPYALSLKQFDRPDLKTDLKEIVFFGRIEPRKGYKLFCDAIDLLPQELLQHIMVTFLGASTTLYSGDTANEVKQRAAAWPCPTRILTDKSHEEALDYLTKNVCLAVIPSHDEVMGYVVMECIGAGIPFLASRIGGIPELIADKDRDYACFTPIEASVLAKRIEQILRTGQKIAHPAIAYEDNRKKWIDWHNQLKQPRVSPQPKPFSKKSAGLVSIILITADPSQIVEATSSSITAQDYPNIELIYACVMPMSNKATVINDAIRSAQGTYVQIIENGDVCCPNFISTCVRVAKRTKSAILTTCFMSSTGNDPNHSLNKIFHLLLGPALTVGTFLNILGTSNAFIKRDVFLVLGGYSETSSHENIYHQFYMQAILKGYSLEVIPEFLFLRQIHSELADDILEPTYDATKLKPYLSVLPKKLKAIIFPPNDNNLSS